MSWVRGSGVSKSRMKPSGRQKFDFVIYGPAKAKSHALRAGMELLGLDGERIKITHHFNKSLMKFPTISIIRNPRDIMVSFMGFAMEHSTEGILKGVIRHGYAKGPLWDYFHHFHHYHTCTSKCAIRAEELLNDGGETMRKVAKFVGEPFLETAYTDIGKIATATKTDAPAKAEGNIHWSPVVEAEWEKARGPEIERLFGYA